MSRFIHLSADIEETLLRPDHQVKALMDLVLGQDVDIDTTREFLREEIRHGHKRFPLSPCDNFDEGNGCQGHDVRL